MYLGRLNNLSINSGHTLLLEGPVQFAIKSGRANCLGGTLKSDVSMMVDEFRQEPIFVAESADVELRAGSGGSWTDVVGSTIPIGWTEAAQIMQHEKGVAVIVGEVDSGKSTISAFLANHCLESGLSVGMIDGDVGQADIGPPATISASRVSEPIRGLYHAKATSSYFAGDTSPSTVPEKLVNLMKRLRLEIEKASDVVIVNTDGWIGDPSALRYKHELLDQLRPDLVLGLSKDDGVTQLLDSVPYPSMRLASSRYAKTRSKEERKKNREAGYRRFLSGSRILKESHQTTQLRMFDRPAQTLFRGDRRFRGFLAGLLDSSEKLLGIGRVREMNSQGWILETRVEEQAKFVEIGNLVLSSRYEEVGYGPLH
jgi:polynucleotide 5'-hydroxyl-kinase GRC3/NOL9